MLKCSYSIDSGQFPFMPSDFWFYYTSHSIPKPFSQPAILNRISCQITQNKVCIITSSPGHDIDILARFEEAHRQCVRRVLHRHTWLSSVFFPQVYAVGLEEKDMNKPQVNLLDNPASRRVVDPSYILRSAFLLCGGKVRSNPCVLTDPNLNLSSRKSM